jgi:hypothetical protein
MAVVFEEMGAVRFHDLVGAIADLESMEGTCIEKFFDFIFHIGTRRSDPPESITGRT